MKAQQKLLKATLERIRLRCRTWALRDSEEGEAVGGVVRAEEQWNVSKQPVLNGAWNSPPCAIPDPNRLPVKFHSTQVLMEVFPDDAIESTPERIDIRFVDGKPAQHEMVTRVVRVPAMVNVKEVDD